MPMPEVTATAPGKIILFGEHAVVYGQPAIAAPLQAVQTRAIVRPGRAGGGVYIVAANLGRTIFVSPDPVEGEHALATAARLLLRRVAPPWPDLDILLHSTIPIASGLGSGAAATTALLRGLSLMLGLPSDPDTLNPLVFEIERLHHGTPSGIDNTVVVYERPIFFVKGSPIETFCIGQPIHLLVGDTGVASPTHLTVGDVRALFEADPARLTPIFSEIGAIARAARNAIEAGDSAALGPLMAANQRLLRDLTVSSAELDRLLQAASRAGALGAKLSGGGRGGNMIALIEPDSRSSVSEALLAAGAKQVIHTVLQPEARPTCLPS